MEKLYAQAAVVGGGSGGFGAAYTLAKHGVKTILIEKNPGLGGTSVYAGVNCWEPGVASGELHQILRQKLSEIKDGCAVCKTVPNARLFDPDSDVHDMGIYPWGLSVKDENADYESTLKRCISLTEGNGWNWRRFQFEPTAMDAVMQGLLAEYSKNLTIMLETKYLSCRTEAGKVKEITVCNEKGTYIIEAQYFVDSTGDIFLARDAGCKTTIGADAGELYQEPSARDKDETNLNGVTYVFRVKKSADPNYIDSYVSTGRERQKHVVSCFNMYPNGDININMLPTFTGQEYLALKDKADEVGEETVRCYWNWLQTQKGMQGYELVHIFPMTGKREGYRLVGKYVLTEQDLLAGVEKQNYKSKTAAIADHPMDRHGTDGGCNELLTPYKIPVSCLETREYDNLFVACRGASFSHIAASSARLSRTILALGEAAGHEICERMRGQS